MKYFIYILGLASLIAFTVSPSVDLSASTSYETDLSYIETSDYEQECLAVNVYHEARSENLAGKYAVADVVLNRVRDDRYPDSICGVIYQGEHTPSWKNPNVLIPVRNRCQFSWYCDGRSDETTELDAWEESKMVAIQILDHNKYRGLTEGATHYHTTFIDPYWASSLQQVGTIGSHIFYRAE